MALACNNCPLSPGGPGARATWRRVPRVLAPRPGVSCARCGCGVPAARGTAIVGRRCPAWR
eukprot:10002517-Lingulodinium_polyedra.AAC.1